MSQIDTIKGIKRNVVLFRGLVSMECTILSNCTLLEDPAVSRHFNIIDELCHCMIYSLKSGNMGITPLTFEIEYHVRVVRETPLKDVRRITQQVLFML